MHEVGTARPGWEAVGRAGEAAGASGRRYSPPPAVTCQPVALAISKRGRLCVLAKLVDAHPLGEYVLAMPYRNRQIVDHVSLPPALLHYAQRHGARTWVVRYDLLGRCWRLPLTEVQREGWLKPSDGRPEWFVPLIKFEETGYQSWEFVETVLCLDAEAPEPAGRQLALVMPL